MSTGSSPGGSITEVETAGVERIPDADRTARPLDLFRLAFGGANTFATCVLGAFPILFGLSFWQALAATLLGLVAGALLLAPLALFGPPTAPTTPSPPPPTWACTAGSSARSCPC